jgi:hypothetical protein
VSTSDNQWHLQQLTQGPASVAGEPVIATPGPDALAASNVSVRVFNGQFHVAYTDQKNALQDVFWAPADGWHQSQLTK